MKNGCGDRDSWCWREEVKLSRWRPEQTCFSERERERERRKEGGRKRGVKVVMVPESTEAAPPSL
jgi:hypothetical protein